MKRLLLQLALAAMLILSCPALLHAQQNVPIVSGVATVNVSGGQNSFRVFLSANVTSFKFTNPTPGQIVTVLFTQDSTGGRTVTFASGITGAGTVTSTAGASTVLQFQFDANSNTWFGVSSSTSGSMVYPGAGIGVSTGSAWTTSLSAPTGALVGAGQTNTYTTGLQDFSAATLGLPLSAGYAPTTAGLFGYDSTNNRAVLGNGTNTSFFPWFTSAPTTNCLAKFSGTLGLQACSTLFDSGSALTTTEPLTVGASLSTSADGTHPSAFSLVGNTTNPSVSANTAGFIGPPAATFTAYALQFPSTAPSASTGDFNCAAPSSGVSLCSFVSRVWSCRGGLGDGLNAVPSGTYLQSTCYNDTGSTVTLTGVKCYVDGGSSSTMNVAGATLGALLTGAVTCTTAYAAGTQSANVALTAGDFLKFTFVADGTAKQTDWVVTGKY
jgi:hypothetical protein